MSSFLLFQDSLNTVVDEKKKIDDELGANILADRRNKLETAAQVCSKNMFCEILEILPKYVQRMEFSLSKTRL